MSKYTFERLGSDRFETLAQALLEKQLRVSGELIQFGEGKDGAREATRTQPIRLLKNGETEFRKLKSGMQLTFPECSTQILTHGLHTSTMFYLATFCVHFSKTSSDANRLAAYLSSSAISQSNRNLGVEVSTEISIRFCTSIVSTPCPSINDLVLLLRQMPVVEELDVWVKHSLVKILEESPWAIERLADRFGEIANRRVLASDELRTRFGIFAQDRGKYPTEQAKRFAMHDRYR